MLNRQIGLAAMWVWSAFAGYEVAGIPPEMCAPAERDIDPSSPPMVLIPGGEYIIGWDGNAERLKKAWPARKGTRRRWNFMLVKEDFAVGDRRCGHRSPMRFEINNLPGTRTVTVKPFYIGKYEVTRREFQQYLRDRNEKPPRWTWKFGIDHYPADELSWFDAVAYCRWLSRKTGRPYRLPTSAEWEVVAQGPERWTFQWGNEFPVQWGDEMVDLFVRKPNAYGVYHMAWFVMEWCQDVTSGHPEGRILRGGFLRQGKMSDIIYFCSYEGRGLANERWYGSGLRLAMDASAHDAPTTATDAGRERSTQKVMRDAGK